MKQLLRWIVGARGNEAADDLADLFYRRAARIGRGRAVLRVAPDLTSLIAFGIGRRLRGGIDRIRRGALAGLPGDLRYATRVLRKTPVFSAIAVLILGLGIGATTAVFAVINAMLLVPTAADTSGTVGIYARRVTKPDEYRPFSYDDYRQIRAAGAPFTDVMAYTFLRPGVTTGGETRRTNAVIATANYFSVFDTRLALGRTFTANEERPGSDIRVVIVAYGYWQHAGGSPAILGSSVRLNGLEYTSCSKA